MLHYRCKRWVINCRRKDLLGASVDYLHRNCRLCDDHFETSQFMNSEKKRLIWNAVPTVFDVPNPPKPIAIKRKLPCRQTVAEKHSHVSYNHKAMLHDHRYGRSRPAASASATTAVSSVSRREVCVCTYKYI